MAIDTVLITGAGFSAPAGIPAQRDLLDRLSSYEPDISIPGAVEFLEAKAKVKEFVEGFFPPCGRGARAWYSVPLEDVYSVLDRAIIEGDSLPPFSGDAISDVRRSLDACITRFLTTVVDEADDSLYFRLVSRLNALYGSNWATATTNWDMLWDRVLMRHDDTARSGISFGVSAFHVGDEPAKLLTWKGEGSILYKLHGSLDWLICPCCHSVFVASDSTATNPFLPGLRCPRCSDCTDDGPEPRLRTILLTPTMLKSVMNPTMRTVHDEAFHAIKRASRVIFVGYSLPEADHDLRYLFRRAIGRRTDVKVILKGTESPSIMLRYKCLFGLPDDAFSCDGFEAYFGLD